LTILAEEAVNLESVDEEQVSKDIESVKSQMSSLAKDDSKLFVLEKEVDYLTALKDAIAA